jgi:hypothetical protein
MEQHDIGTQKDLVVYRLESAKEDLFVAIEALIYNQDWERFRSVLLYLKNLKS